MLCLCFYSLLALLASSYSEEPMLANLTVKVKKQLKYKNIQNSTRVCETTPSTLTIKGTELYLFLSLGWYHEGPLVPLSCIFTWEGVRCTFN